MELQLSALLLLLLYLSVSRGQVDPTYCLLISMDGFRWDYLDIVNARGRATPNFNALIEDGVRAEYMKNAYVTVTWPNHWSIATGMHVESHGVVANSYYDSRFNASFSGRSTPESHWYNNGSKGAGGEPIWVTYQRAAPYHRSAMVIWPGGNVEINGVKATYRVPSDNRMPFRERVDHIIEWFSMEEEPAHLGILYFGEPDETGHQHGPFSQEVEDMILELDGVLGYLIQRLEQTGLSELTNIILTSDHGMNEVLEVYKMADYIDPDWYTLSGGATPGSLVIPKPGYETEVYNALQKVPNSKVYWKDEIPREFFYTYNERIPSILLMMDLGYMLCCQHHGQNSTVPVGDHGYSNDEPSMHPFFIAHGGAFKSGYTSKPFNNTDIYPLLCYLLGIQPGPNNGSLANIQHILREYTELGEGRCLPMWLMTACVFVMVLACILMLYNLMTSTRKKKHPTDPLLYVKVDDDTIKK